MKLGSKVLGRIIMGWSTETRQDTNVKREPKPWVDVEFR